MLDGGAGIDTLIGGTGNDIYIIDAPNDQILEFGNEGNDTVIVETSFYQMNFNIENADAALTVNTFIQGNNSDNSIVGNLGNDTLDGGFGTDTLTGGAGNDTFVFHFNFGHDTITDFATGQDTLEIDDGLFSSASAALAASRQSGSDVIITVNSSTNITLKNVSLSNLHTTDFHVLGGAAIKTSALSEPGDLAANSVGGGQIDNQLSQLVQAMASFSATNAGIDPAFTTQAANDAGLHSAIAAAWHQ